MRKVKIYVEGATRGKGGNEAANRALRRGFGRFVEKLGIEVRPEFVSCGGRQQTWSVAWANFVRRGEEDFVVLLVDSEEITKHAPENAWVHLRERDSWSDLEERHRRYVFMMVTAMETWLIADAAALSRTFGRDFRGAAIPHWQDLESVPKATVFEALMAATSGKYSKGERSFDLFGEVDPVIVATRCPHADHFCKRLKSLCV